MWFYLAGRGVPLPGPHPRAISTTVRCTGEIPEENMIGVGSPRLRPFRGIACTAPAHGGGGGAPKARVGWGR